MFNFSYSQTGDSHSNLPENNNSFQIQKPDDLRNSIFENAPSKYKNNAFERITIAFASMSAYNGYQYANSGMFYPQNDSLTKYINQIARKVIPKSLISERGNMILISKNAYFNAEALSSGHIILNIGIFDNIKDEASIAGMIAHEFSHYFLNHMI